MPDPTTPDIDAGLCCDPTCCIGTDPSAVTEDEPMRQPVRDGYARIARGEVSSCCGSTETDPTRFAQQVGYDAAVPTRPVCDCSCCSPSVNCASVSLSISWKYRRARSPDIWRCFAAPASLRTAGTARGFAIPCGVPKLPWHGVCVPT